MPVPINYAHFRLLCIHKYITDLNQIEIHRNLSAKKGKKYSEVSFPCPNENHVTNPPNSKDHCSRKAGADLRKTKVRQSENSDGVDKHRETSSATEMGHQW